MLSQLSITFNGSALSICLSNASWQSKAKSNHDSEYNYSITLRCKRYIRLNVIHLLCKYMFVGPWLKSVPVSPVDVMLQPNTIYWNLKFLFIILISKCISYSALFWNRRRDNCSSVHMMMIPIEAIFVLQFKLANFQTLCIKEFLKMFIQLIFAAVEKCIRKNVRLGNWLVLREIQCFQTHFCFCGKSERAFKIWQTVLAKSERGSQSLKILTQKCLISNFTSISFSNIWL